MATLEINGQRVEVDDTFLSLSPEQQEATVEEIAASLGPGKAPESNGFLGQANKGIANAIDFINPFDDPAWKDVLGGKLHTGSAADGMRNLGIAVADRPPETIVEGMGRGVGDASAALIPVVKGLQALRSVGGSIGAFADDAYRALTTKGGVAAEVTAGAVGGGAREVSEAAGAPEWVSGTAEVLAPALALPGAVAATRGAVRGLGAVADKLPVTGYGMRVARDLKKSLTPMSEGGANAIAREEIHRRVGLDRTEEVAANIDPDNPMNLTPAQMTGDPGLMDLEGAARGADADLDARLRTREDNSRDLALNEVRTTDGDYANTTAFFRARLDKYRKNISGAVERVMTNVAAGDVAPNASEATNSARVVSRLKSELADAESVNSGLWAAVPLDDVVPTTEARKAAKDIWEMLPRAQHADFPPLIRGLLLEEGGLGEFDTAREVHGLYSKLKGIARAAMSGEPGKRNPNTARIANEVAEALLDDLGAVDQSTPVGRAITDALAHTRAMHETFDRGAPGRILKRTATGDDAIPDVAALDRTVGRSGIDGDNDAATIVNAAPGSQAEIGDYLRAQFSEALLSPTGDFSPAAAHRWLRQNKELLLRYPGLDREFRAAIGNRDKAEAFQVRAGIRIKLADASYAAKFTGEAHSAIKSILQAENPAKAAVEIYRTARKDTSGKALAGIKAAFSNFLADESLNADGLLSGRKMWTLLNDPKMRPALARFYTEAEVGRLRRIATALKTLDAPARTEGIIIDRPSNRLLEMVARVAGARAGGEIGAGSAGGSIQTANIMSGTARKMLAHLTNDRARALLMDAVEDPKLMRELLTEPKGVELPPRTRRALAPYILGAAATAGDEE